jgi:hypothetical protein
MTEKTTISALHPVVFVPSSVWKFSIDGAEKCLKGIRKTTGMAHSPVRIAPMEFIATL